MSNYYKGKILISTPDLSGDIFSRSVVLIIDHNEHGAFGLILNKKIPFDLPQNSPLVELQIDIYEGGPVEKDKTFFIIKGEPVSEYYLPIDPDHHLTEDIEGVLIQLIQNNLTLDQIKVFSGYSGWSKGQLEKEIENKFWTPVDIYNLDYTTSTDTNLWKKVMQNLGGEFLLWANSPEDISMN